MGESEEVEKLAESLKNSGLAASITDAINKAKNILGYSNKGVKIRVGEPKPEQKEKVDKIIKEVDQEIEEKKQEAPPSPEKQPEESKEEDLSKFEDPSFNVAESDMKIDEMTNGEIMTNDKEILDKEKEADKVEKTPETQNAFDEVQSNVSETPKSMVMTNDEVNKEENNDSEETKEEEEGEDTEEEKEKPELSKEEKETTDLTKLFNVNK